MMKEAEMLALADYLDKLEANMLKNDADILLDNCDPPSIWADRIRAAAAPAPAARVIDREAVALEIWHRFANSNVQTFEDETHKAEYLMCADAILALKPTMAGEPVAWQVWHAIDGWGGCSPFDVEYYENQGIKTRPLYASPAPSGRDPATIEACAKVADQMAADTTDRLKQFQPEGIVAGMIANTAATMTSVAEAIRALAAPAAVTDERHNV